jgi:hypothetical protein
MIIVSILIFNAFFVRGTMDVVCVPAADGGARGSFPRYEDAW